MGAVMQCITHGPRAGQPKSTTDILLDQNTLLKRALAALRRNGFEPVRARIGISHAPNIEVAAGAATQRLVDDGQAVCFLTSPNRYKWQARFESSIIFWIERRGS